jgi:hypothetical protein
VPPRQAPETHPYFGTLFRVPDSHTFWRNAASSCVSGQNALKSAAEFENDFWKIRERGGSLRSDQPGHFDLFRLATTEWKPSRNLRNGGRS